MSGWTAEELDRIGAADELRIAVLRPDGSLRPATPIWVVRAGDCARGDAAAARPLTGAGALT
jgi:hypothetical protein